MLLHWGCNEGPEEAEVKLKSNHLGSGSSTITNDWISWASLSLSAPGISFGPCKWEDDHPFHRRCPCDSRNDIWNMLMREFFSKNDSSTHPLSLINSPAYLRGKKKKKKRKIFYTKRWGCFHPEDLQIHLPRRNVNDYPMNKSLFTSKNYPTSGIARVFLFFMFVFLYPLDGPPCRDCFSEAITETGPSDGIANDWDHLQQFSVKVKKKKSIDMRPRIPRRQVHSTKQNCRSWNGSDLWVKSTVRPYIKNKRWITLICGI